ncbi:MAG TPA: hypothetical protein PKJ19_16395 [Flavobacteriales bacterium]|nr:hypothetical protein [Flavobacteriales bacterium]HNU57114.1 hypothetical protein [Flavobacteriales bacterium]
MNERIYGSRCHAIDVEWEGERLDGIAYTFDDCVHILSWDELMSVEVSGRSFLHDYISTPSQWPEPTAAVAPLMDARPGATEPGMGMLDLEHQDFEMRPLTGLEKAFVERYRAYSSLSMLAALFKVNKEAVGQYSRLRGLLPPRKGHKIHMDDLRRLWSAKELGLAA